jgi:dihydroorotase
MPNTFPPTTTQSAAIEKISLAEKKSYVDFGIFVGINNDNIKKIEQLAKYCCGFKIFLGQTTESFQLEKQNLEDALKRINKTQLITMIHAEDNHCLKKHRINENNLYDHLASRPSICEKNSIIHILNSSRNISSLIHICHISSYLGLSSLRQSSKNISVGVTPHHLLFDIESINENYNQYKVNPPIRNRFDRESLWNGILNGSINLIESDHAPHTIDEKEKIFNESPSGIPGTETMYPLFLAEAKKQTLEYEKLISLLSEKPAELLNIPKGKIIEGNDADFIVVDNNNVVKIKNDYLHSKCGWSPYEGKVGIFPSNVFLRGEEVVENYELTGVQGTGSYVKK